MRRPSVPWDENVYRSAELDIGGATNDSEIEPRSFQPSATSQSNPTLEFVVEPKLSYSSRRTDRLRSNESTSGRFCRGPTSGTSSSTNADSTSRRISLKKTLEPVLYGPVLLLRIVSGRVV